MAKAYKMFKVKKSEKGKIFPLFVLTNEATPMRQWIEAECGERVGSKVKSKLGLLAFRPAWHLSDIPLAVHIGVKNEDGKIAYINDEHIWCEVEYDDTIDYQEEANKVGTVNGKLVPRKAFLDYVPVKGSYRYKTSPNQLGEWIMAGNIYINKILTDEEVRNILKQNGYEPMYRKNGDINLEEYGFVQGIDY